MGIHTQGETTRTKPHRRVERILDKMQISYESEHGFYPYSVDIYVSEWHIGIEVDGPQHSAAKDRIRDEIIRERYFLPILRLSSVGLSPQQITEKVEDFVVIWAQTAAQRKFQWRTQL